MAAQRSTLIWDFVAHPWSVNMPRGSFLSRVVVVGTQVRMREWVDDGLLRWTQRLAPHQLVWSNGMLDPWSGRASIPQEVARSRRAKARRCKISQPMALKLQSVVKLCSFVSSLSVCNVVTD